MLGSVFLVLLSVLLFCLYSMVQKKYAYFRDRGIVHNPPRFPAGNVKLVRTIEDLWVGGIAEYFQFHKVDTMCGMYFGLQALYVVTDLDVIRDILVRDFANFTDHNIFEMKDNCQDPLGPSLYSLRGEPWRHMRTKMSSVYSSASNDEMFEMTLLCASNLRNYVQWKVATHPEQPLNAQDLSLRYLCDAIGSCGFGIDCKGTQEEDPVILKIVNKAFNPPTYMVWFFILLYPFLSDGWASVWVNKDTKKFLEIIEETVKYREENHIRRNDIFQVWMDVNRKGVVLDDESGEALGMSQPNGLKAEGFILFFFSYFMTRSILASALYELAANPEIQERARQEIFNVMGETAGEEPLTFQDTERMVYMQQVIDETLRKYPGAGGLERVANEDYMDRKRGRLITKGASLVVPVSAIHNDPEIYPNPRTFDPDRMTKEKIKQRHPCAFLPYGGGPRECPGIRLVNSQLKLGIISLLGAFRLTLNRRTVKGTDLLSIKSSVWLDVQPL